jgi:type I restriction enzyme S subunit
MALALFKSWFVDVDPARAIAEDLLKEGVLEIGDGYRAKNSELGPPGLPFIRGGDLNNGFDTAGAEILNQTSVAKASNKISREGDVAFTSKGTIGRFARVKAHTERFVYSPQVCYWRSLDVRKLNPTVLYCWMTSGDLLTQILAVSGQTDMAPYASLRDQRAMEVPIFPENQHDLAAKIEPLLVRQAMLEAESRTLTTLRDTLLPKLISSELRVKAAEKIVEAVA